MLRWVCRLIARKEKFQLRVLLYHEISPDEEDKFYKQIKWIAKRWTFVTPNEFISILNGSKKITSNSVLLTFDDGLMSGHNIAIRVLKKFNIKAIYFIVYGYSKLLPNDYWREYISKNIYPGMPVDKVADYWRNMSFEHLRELISEGHFIGGHTGSHKMLSSIHEDDELSNEIVESANSLEKELGIAIENFAYTFGNIDSLSAKSCRIAARRFRYIYTGLGGDNINLLNPKIILRDSIKPSDSHLLIGALLEGVSDWYFKKSIKKLKSWLV